MFTVYILYSKKYNQIYISFTSDLANRFLSHTELATKGHTIKYRPWIIAHTEEYPLKSEATKRELSLNRQTEEHLHGESFGKNLAAQMVRT